MRIYFKKGTSIQVTKELGELISDEIINTQNHNKYIRWTSPEKLTILLSEIVAIK